MPLLSNLGRLLSKSAYKVDFIWDKSILYIRFLVYLTIYHHHLLTIYHPAPVSLDPRAPHPRRRSRGHSASEPWPRRRVPKGNKPYYELL